MGKYKKRQFYTVVITSRAKQRWRDLGGCGELTADMVEKKMAGAYIALGVGTVEVEIGCGLKAICTRALDRVWMTVTVAGSGEVLGDESTGQKIPDLVCRSAVEISGIR